jgi:hypothetical protein
MDNDLHNVLYSSRNLMRKRHRRWRFAAPRITGRDYSVNGNTI